MIKEPVGQQYFCYPGILGHRGMLLTLSLLFTTSLPTIPASAPSPRTGDPESKDVHHRGPGCSLHGTKHVPGIF